MPETLILVDFESAQNFDISTLDETYRGLIFVGANQATPKAAREPSTAHLFARVDFMKIEGTGKNALDFHIAFHLGRLFETSPSTACVVLAKDKGYDPLLRHLKVSRGWRQATIHSHALSLEPCRPKSYQQAIMDQFRRTADQNQEQAQQHVKHLLVGAGVVAALVWLLGAGK